MNFQYILGTLASADGANKGENEFLLEYNNSFSISAAIAFPFKRIYGILIIKKTITSDVMKYFYNKIYEIRTDIFKELEDPPILVWDNATVNKSKLIKNFIQGSWAKIFTIKPYSPWLNPTEHLIGVIKEKIKKQVARGKSVISLHFCLGFLT